MLRILLRSILVTAALIASWSLDALTSGKAEAAKVRPVRCRPHQYGNPDLFYNFYVPPTCCGVGAQMYVAPVPVPAVVGHTYYTYQPLMPHEFLYRHHRRYHRYYNEGRGLTRTSVVWW